MDNMNLDHATANAGITPTTVEPGADRCPLCSDLNNCALATDPGATDCWCRQASISPLLLARIADGDRHRRCVCAHCAAAAEQLATPAQ